jgi:hypothetical protein
VAIRVARAQGCTCDVEVTFGRADHPFAGIAALHQTPSLAHDDWCPLIRVLDERKPGPFAHTQAILCKLERDER